MLSYKKYLQKGDIAIPKKTANRYKITKIPNETCTNEEEAVTNTEEEMMEIDDAQNPLIPDHLFQKDEIDDLIDEYSYDWAETLTNEMNDEKYSNDSNYPRNLQDFLYSDEFSQTINTEVDKSAGEIFLMILKFCVLNYLPISTMTNLFQLVNAIFKSPILPKSRFILDKLLNPKTSVEYHGVCSDCNAYIGKLEIAQTIKNCPVCNCDLDLQNPSNISFFVLINPARQISDLLHLHENYYDKVMNGRESETGFIKDVYDGKEYRRFVKNLPPDENKNYVSAMFNTDGAPKYKSSTFSIWPLYLQINELPAQERLNNVVTCGLWFNKIKPEMTVFIDKFVDLINTVNDTGITCTINNVEKNVKLYVITCCADAVARAPIQGIKQFNGHYGCNWCLHPGMYVENSIKYNNIIPVPNNRTHSDTVSVMINQREGLAQDGIKYPSPLINMKYFDIVKGFLPDYLHSCLEGVTEQFTSYFLKSFTDDDMKNLNAQMKEIAVPQQISRLCRPLSDRNQWKGKEWENFALYYSVPLLAPYLSKKRLNHWLMFVESLYILLKDKIHITELNRADIMLRKFVFQSENIYGMKAMTYNLHLMIHLSESVLNWGPLWTNSTLSFESANYNLLRAIKSAKGVTQQIVRYVNVHHSLRVVENVVSHYASPSVNYFCNDILTSKIKNCTKHSEIMYFGRGYDEIENTYNLCIPEGASFYIKIVKDRCLYESMFKLKKRSNNSYVLLKDGRYACIIGFIVIDNDESTILNMIHTIDYANTYSMLRVIELIDNEQTIIKTSDIDRICVNINIGKKQLLCAVPNLLHN